MGLVQFAQPHYVSTACSDLCYFDVESFFFFFPKQAFASMQFFVLHVNKLR